MGYEYVKRPVYMKSGLQDAGGSTFSSAVTITGTLTYTGAAAFGSRVKLPTEAITGTSDEQTLTNYGVSFVTYGTSGKINDIRIPKPTAAGDLKYIFAVKNTTSVELNFNTSSTATVFWGTTFNTVTCAAASTGSPAGTPAGTMALELVGASTTQWAIMPGSTFNWDIAGSTGSSEQS